MIRTATIGSVSGYLAIPDFGVERPAGASDFNDLARSGGAEAVSRFIDAAAIVASAPIANVFVSSAPESLRRPTPPSGPYPLAELGEVLMPAAESLRRVIQAPDAIIGGALLAAGSLAAQALADVELDDRRIPLSLWLLSIAESGERKSAVDGETMRAAREHERDLAQSHEYDLLAHAAAVDEWNARRGAAKADAKKAKGKGLAEALEALGPHQPRLSFHA